MADTLTQAYVLEILANWNQLIGTVQNVSPMPHLYKVDFKAKNIEIIDAVSQPNSPNVFPETAPALSVSIDGLPHVDYFTAVTQLADPLFLENPFLLLLLIVKALHSVNSLEDVPVEMDIETGPRQVKIRTGEHTLLFFFSQEVL